ncbi:hypothetical protein M407DRAFT_31347 [Tulasnella calospora MUT 4182]|uniref:Uncharacterized protein n=1 Tax=Tulasnella calospora MUT 4182 TaxID=1051891 RepID=A0A0C3Q6M2_9AGAM|nr:hypothetical protein M407DRAFT_31347 [Tulasnella calospora MUT 4182]
MSSEQEDAVSSLYSVTTPIVHGHSFNPFTKSATAVQESDASSKPHHYIKSNEALVRVL